MPEGIAVTLSMAMIKQQGGMRTFLANFLSIMEDEEGYWMHKCSNFPKADINNIYLIVANRLWGRVYCGGFKRYDPDNPKYGYTADGTPKVIDFNYIILAGPFERCPFKRELKGFQGFRYCEKLWD